MFHPALRLVAFSAVPTFAEVLLVFGQASRADQPDFALLSYRLFADECPRRGPGVRERTGDPLGRRTRKRPPYIATEVLAGVDVDPFGAEDEVAVKWSEDFGTYFFVE